MTMSSRQEAEGRRQESVRLPSAFRFLPTATPRGWMLLVLAGLFYFFANQTQTSWLYVFTAIVLSLWLLAALAPAGMLRGLTLRRRLNGHESAVDLELRVGDPLTVTLELANAGRTPALHLRGLEVCAFAPEDDRQQTLFAPNVPPREAVSFSYRIVCARRGWFDFAPVSLQTRAPFGFFAARRALAAASGVLIFPEYRDLEHFPLLDRRPTVSNPFVRVGLGSEFIGVREYRPGDSPRHVHWRTTARAGQLMVKEFSEETQPGLTIALDARASAAIGADEHNTFELAVKVAASLAHYADQRGLALTLAANNPAWPAPLGPVSRWAALNYLARVQAEGEHSFAECLRGLHSSVFVAALLAAPDHAAIAPLVELKAQGVTVLAVVIDPAPFAPERDGEGQRLAGALSAAGLTVRLISAEPDWERTLTADDRAAVRW
jgi:uncharacterized protein (DUF58 family)